MDRKIFYTKAAKGLRELTGKTNSLRQQPELRRLLKEIDGKSTASDMLLRLDGYSESGLRKALLALLNEDYIREFVPTPEYAPQVKAVPGADSNDGTLDFTPKEESARDQLSEHRVKAPVGRSPVAGITEQAERETKLAARLAAEEEARREAETDTRRDTEGQGDAYSRQHAEASIAAATGTTRYGRPAIGSRRIAIGLLVLILAGLAIIHVVPFDGQRARFEDSASTRFQQPVVIDALNLSLLPTPHWRIKGITIGKAGQLKVAQLNARAELATLFGDGGAIDELELDTVALSNEALGWLLFGKPHLQNIGLTKVYAKNVRLVSPGLAMPSFDARIALGEHGDWQKIHLEDADKKLSAELTPTNGSVQIDFNAASYHLPFDSALVLTDFQAKAVASPAELAVTAFSGRLYGGVLRGNARLQWGEAWRLSGELHAVQFDAAGLAPHLFEEGWVDGRAQYASSAADSATLLAGRHLDGEFIARKATLRGIGIGSMLGDERGGTKSQFAEIAGNFSVDDGRTQLRQLHLAAGMMSATGEALVDENRELRGRFTVVLKSPAVQRSASVALSGTLEQPRYNRR